MSRFLSVCPLRRSVGRKEESWGNRKQCDCVEDHGREHKSTRPPAGRVMRQQGGVREPQCHKVTLRLLQTTGATVAANWKQTHTHSFFTFVRCEDLLIQVLSIVNRKTSVSRLTIVPCCIRKVNSPIVPASAGWCRVMNVKYSKRPANGAGYPDSTASVMKRNDLFDHCVNVVRASIFTLSRTSEMKALGELILYPTLTISNMARFTYPAKNGIFFFKVRVGCEFHYPALEHSIAPYLGFSLSIIFQPFNASWLSLATAPR